MILQNVKILGGLIGRITVKEGKISEVSLSDHLSSPPRATTPGERVLDLTCGSEQAGGKVAAAVFPGLINSHDHLDYNLFPQLGNHQYTNYLDWGRDIHQVNSAVIQAVLKVPKPLRVQWGLYKNMLAGVTTVVQHGEIFKKTEADRGEPLIHIFNGCKSLHSVKLEKYWRLKLNRPFAGKRPFVIHVGEGTDAETKAELGKLLRWNLFNRDLIGIHGLALEAETLDKVADSNQAAAFKALVWCPVSNYFLYGKTADISAIKEKTAILFGTDAAVSAHWDIWAHLRLAKELGYLSDAALMGAVGEKAAEIWKLSNTGKIEPGYDADLIITTITNTITTSAVKPSAHFFNTRPEHLLLVMCKGRVTLFDHSLLGQMDLKADSHSNKDTYTDTITKLHYCKIYLAGIKKYVLGDLPGLVTAIRKYYPDWTLPLPIGLEPSPSTQTSY